MPQSESPPPHHVLRVLTDQYNLWLEFKTCRLAGDMHSVQSAYIQ